MRAFFVGAFLKIFPAAAARRFKSPGRSRRFAQWWESRFVPSKQSKNLHRDTEKTGIISMRSISYTRNRSVECVNFQTQRERERERERERIYFSPFYNIKISNELLLHLYVDKVMVKLRQGKRKKLRFVRSHF